jgi:hypothetical protein
VVRSAVPFITETIKSCQAVKAVSAPIPGVLHLGMSTVNCGGHRAPGESTEMCTKIGAGLATTGYEERLHELVLPTLTERRHQAGIHMAHKIFNEKSG